MSRKRERVAEVVEDHLLDTLFEVVDRRTIVEALEDAYEHGRADGLVEATPRLAALDFRTDDGGPARG